MDVFFADGASGATGATLSECETVVYRATICHSGGTRCNIQGGTITITTPDGVAHDVTPVGGVPLLANSACVDSKTVTYTVDPADISGGVVTATTDYTGIGHTGPGTTDGVSTGSTDISNDVAFCDDGVFCNGAETCDPAQFDGSNTRQGVCEAGTPPTCDDGDACTADSCDPGTDACSNTTISCDDNNACTADSCDPASGCVNTTISCEDNNACTADSCDPASGCVNTTISCGDNNACTTDSCDPASGCVNTTISCEDNNDCTTDSCNPATGCVNSTISCDDNNDCTDDSCDPASGCVNSTISCDDRNPCTDDSCDPASGCVNADNGTCQSGCRITGGGQVEPDSSTSATSATFGGQVGAPFGNIGCFSEADNIQGNWQHSRKKKAGNFHAKDFYSLVCSCVGTVDADGNCVPGPTPPPGQATDVNHVCFSGVGSFAPTNGKKTETVAFRVEAQDEGEPGTDDSYDISIWRPTGAETAEEIALQVCCNCDPSEARDPDIRDAGNLLGGNIQLHKQTPKSGQIPADATCPSND